MDLKNIALNSQGKTQGTYQKSANVNGKPSWVSNNQAIWWIPKYSEWGIGELSSIGNEIRRITGVTDDNKNFGLPNDPKYTWKYWNGQSFITPPNINDIDVNCIENEITTTTATTTTTTSTTVVPTKITTQGSF